MRATASLSRRQKDGSVTRQHVEAAANKGNALAIARLEAASAIPESLEYLADIFYRLCNMRETDGMVGGKRFTPAHIKAGMELFGWSLTPLEVEGIVELDRVYLETVQAE